MSKTFPFQYRSDVQGLRGIAVLLVVLYHLGLPLTGGYIGVDVFFVISGFVITGGILRTLNSTQTLDIQDFFRRRVRRLLPALSVVLSICILLGVIFGPEISQKVSGRTAIAAIFLNANHYLYRSGGYFQPAVEENFFLHTWSLSVEEQFYLVFPFVLFFAWKVFRHDNRVFRVLMGLSFASFLFSMGLMFFRLPELPGQELAFYSSATRAWQFGVGALVACLLPALDRIENERTMFTVTGFGWLGFSIVLLSSLALTPESIYPGYFALFPTAGTALMIASGCLPRSNRLAEILSHPILKRFGDLSYSWYLWHWPLIVFAHASFPNTYFPVLFSAVISLILAWCTERYVEKPIRTTKKLKSRWVLSLSIVVPIVCWWIQTVFPPLSLHVMQLRNMQMQYAAIGCDSLSPYDSNSQDCRWGSDNGWKVVLLGDSNARQHIPALKAIVSSKGGELHAATSSACPFLVDVLPIVGGEPKEGCRNWVTKSVEEILIEKPEVVIISSAVDGYSSSSRWNFVDLNGTPVRLEDAVENTTRVVQTSGAKVVYIAPIPKLYNLEGRPATRFGARCSWFALQFNTEDCLPAWSPSDERYLRFDSSIYNGLSSTLVNLSPSLCHSELCQAHDGLDWVYHDGGHLSVYGSLLVRGNRPTDHVLVRMMRQA